MRGLPCTYKVKSKVAIIYLVSILNEQSSYLNSIKIRSGISRLTDISSIIILLFIKVPDFEQN